MLNSLARALTGRRSAWLTVALFLLVIGGLTGGLSGVGTAARGSNLPADSESQQVASILEQFPNADTQAVLVVAHRPDGQALDGRQLGEFKQLATELNKGGRTLMMPSEDGKAVLSTAPIAATEDDAVAKDLIKDLRADLEGRTPAGLDLQVTGGPAFGADISDSFSGADVTLLMVTVGIVAVLLLLTYRSPVLWLVPLVVVALADQAAGKLANWLSVLTGWHAEVGIVSVLVFGAGTNYALLLISRYREELHRNEDHREALRTAWVGTFPAIVASNATVVLGLLTLLVAILPDTRALGLSSAAGLLLAVVSVLVGLPAALAIVGRGIFWPLVPRPGTEPRTGRVWGRIATAVVGRPVRALVAGLVLLAVMASGLFTLKVGLDQADQFRVDAESIDGLEVVSAHYPAGFTAPISVVADQSRVRQVTAALQGMDGVETVTPIGQGDQQVHLQVVGAPAPGTDEALDLVRDLRTTAHEVDGAQALVGGAIAQDLDQREAQDRDFRVIAPMILAISLLVLVALTRSLLVPVLLLAVNVASAAAAIGAGGVLSTRLMDSPALAIQVPLFAFLFLVALGIDYTIFLVERAQHDGMVQAVRHTGAVITSAGIVLAAVFAALGVLPLVVMGQLGIIVCLGVLVDTLVVRTVIVPAIFGVLGRA